MRFEKDDIYIMQEYKNRFIREVKEFVTEELKFKGVRLSTQAKKDLVLQVATDLLNGQSVKFVRSYIA